MIFVALSSLLFVIGVWSFTFGLEELFFGSKKAKGFSFFIAGWVSIAAATIVALNLAIP